MPTACEDIVLHTRTCTGTRANSTGTEAGTCCTRARAGTGGTGTLTGHRTVAVAAVVTGLTHTATGSDAWVGIGVQRHCKRQSTLLDSTTANGQDAQSPAALGMRS